jgi:hypothetical protein
MSFLISAGRMPKRGDCSCWLHLEMLSGVGLVSMVSVFFVRVSMSRRLENDSREAMVVFGVIGSVCEVVVCDWNQRVRFRVIYVWCWSEHESSTRRQPGRSAVRARCDAPPRDRATNEATFAVAQLTHFDS